MQAVPEPFLSKLFCLSVDPEIISFAGGFPDAHLSTIRNVYGVRCHFFCDLIDDQEPKGGIFLWITLPGGVKGMDLFHAAVEQKVGIMPGLPFYYDETVPESNSGIKLNFSSINEEIIQAGMERLQTAFSRVM